MCVADGVFSTPTLHISSNQSIVKTSILFLQRCMNLDSRMLSTLHHMFLHDWESGIYFVICWLLSIIHLLGKLL